ncbi:hypothetical protein LguiB_034953 [Lonicera macranthoides]
MCRSKNKCGNCNMKLPLRKSILCARSVLGGFFLKVTQVIGKPDLAPAAWVRRLVTLCDQAAATPSSLV